MTEQEQARREIELIRDMISDQQTIPVSIEDLWTLRTAALALCQRPESSEDFKRRVRQSTDYISAKITEAHPEIMGILMSKGRPTT